MTPTAIISLVLITFLTGFAVGYVIGKAGPTEEGSGHPYDLDE